MKLIYPPLPAAFVAPSWPLPEEEKTAQPSTFATAGDREGSNSEVLLAHYGQSKCGWSVSFVTNTETNQGNLVFI